MRFSLNGFHFDDTRPARRLCCMATARFSFRGRGGILHRSPMPAAMAREPPEMNPFPPTRILRLAGLLLTLAAPAALAAETLHPVKMSGAQIAGAIFEDYDPVVREHGGNTTHDVEVFLSSNRQFDAGMYRSGKVRFDIDEPYGVHEYMHFLEGGVTLTSSDGTVTEVAAGDSVVIPAEWTGVWDTDGYTKIYVIYSPDGPIEE